MSCRARSLSMLPGRWACQPNSIHTMSGPAARSNITASRFGSSWASARLLCRMDMSSFAWLVAQVLPREHREDHVREAVFDRCRALRVEPPSAGRVDRLIRSAFHTFEERWCASVFEQLTAATQLALDELLVTPSANDENHA